MAVECKYMTTITSITGEELKRCVRKQNDDKKCVLPEKCDFFVENKVAYDVLNNQTIHVQVSEFIWKKMEEEKD